MLYVNFQNEKQQLQEEAMATLTSVASFSQVLMICFFSNAALGFFVFLRFQFLF
jgi:hypothetical protein